MAKRGLCEQRFSSLYSAMKQRFGPKYWKSGARKGQMRHPGMDLPFSRQQFIDHAMSLTGGAWACPYCGVPTDAQSCSVDHEIPVSRGGSLDLENLGFPCQRCNRIKGELTADEFYDLLACLQNMHPLARKNVLERLATGEMGMRMRYYGRSA